MTDARSKFKITAAFAAVYLLWGSTYLAIRIAIETVPPFLMAGTRFLCAGGILYFFTPALERRQIIPLHWRSAFIIGGLLLMMGNGGVVWSEQFVPSGIAALVVATVPLWTILLETLWMRHEKPNLKVLLGVLLGFSGLWILIRPDTREAGIPLAGALVLLISALSWSIGSIYARHAPRPHASFLATAMEMTAGGTLLVLASVLTGEWKHVPQHGFSVRSLLALAYLIFFGALIGFTAYKYMLKTTSPTLSSTYAYVNPVIAVFLGTAFAGEPLSPQILTGTAVIVAAVVLITFSDRARRKRGA